MIELPLAVAAFIAGVLMFLAPCTLPLVPAYLAFIAGVKTDGAVSRVSQIKIFRNSLFYCLGFSIVFITLGILAGFAGQLVGSLRHVLLPFIGVFVIILGLEMLHLVRPLPLFANSSLKLPKFATAGTPTSALAIGAAFSLGWTPCVGPILATILLLAGTTGTVLEGAALLTLFSLGLSIPFILTAAGYGYATRHIGQMQRFVRVTEIFGGVFLLLIGLLLLTNNFDLTIVYGQKLLELVGVDVLLDYY